MLSSLSEKATTGKALQNAHLSGNINLPPVRISGDEERIRNLIVPDLIVKGVKK